MEPNKKIGLSVLVSFIFLIIFYLNENNEESYSYEQSSTYSYNQSTIEIKNKYNYSNYTKESILSNKEKDEIFKTTVEGYRELTYWGNEHPIQNKTRDMNKEELNDYLNENYISKDDDLYWGSEY